MIFLEQCYRRIVIKSVLWDGFGIEKSYVGMFTKGTEPMKRGDRRNLTFFFNGKNYSVEIQNLNNPPDKRKNDAYQIRYTPNGPFAQALQKVFFQSEKYIQQERQQQEKINVGKRLFVTIPKERQEYLDIYPTEEPTVFLCVPIILDKEV